MSLRFWTCTVIKQSQHDFCHYQEKAPGFALTWQCRDSALVSTHHGLRWFYLDLTVVQCSVLASALGTVWVAKLQRTMVPQTAVPWVNGGWGRLGATFKEANCVKKIFIIDTGRTRLRRKRTPKVNIMFLPLKISQCQQLIIIFPHSSEKDQNFQS